jgi:hypothetical protein
MREKEENVGDGGGPKGLAPTLTEQSSDAEAMM